MNENPFAPWSDKYLVRIACFDEQHKEAFAVLNTFARAITEGKSKEDVGEILLKFITHYKIHAASEEKLLVKHNYIGLEKQRQDHATMCQELESLYKLLSKGQISISLELAAAIRDKMVTHILGPDKAYGEFLTGQGVR